MAGNSSEWKKGSPNQAGYYVIAIKYDNGMGTFGTDYWDSEQGWSVDENVVGYIPLRQVLNAANIEFPEDE